MKAAPAPLRSFDEALADLLSRAQPWSDTEVVNTFDADGRVLAEDLVSELHVPPLDNSYMDGYAVRSSDVKTAGTVLRVAQRIPAGNHGTELGAGEAARIFTGAPIPPGADAVVMQEDCEAIADPAGGLGQVRVNTVPESGQWVRRAGDDVKRGAVMLERGHRMTPGSVGLAAGIGRAQLTVSRRPRVALFSTGDELVMPGELPPSQMPPGKIYNSNRYFMRALLKRLGCEVTDCGIVPDKRDATIAALRDASQNHDLLITSGGVSVGEEDHIKPAVEQLGSLDWWQVSMKPGKPLACGRVGNAHFIGLPGNPVSSFIAILLMVKPFVLKLQGASKLEPVRAQLPAHFELRGDKRREFLRVRRNAAGGLDLFPNQSSAVLTSTVWGDGLVNNPPGNSIAHGDLVEFLSFAELMS